MFHVEFENNMEIRSYSDICKIDNTLRPYQQKAKKEIFESWDKVNSVMFQMPTGTGKTRLFTSLIYDINNFSIKRKEAIKILIIAHRTELIDQIDESLQKYKVAHGVIAGNKRERKNYRLPVQVASIQTLTNRYNIEDAKKLNVQFVIIDEAHHALASSYKKLWTIYPNAKWLGVTATPWRMNHKSFTDLFDKIIVSMPIKDFIKQGYLSSYKYYSLRDDSSIKKRIDNIETDRFGEYKEDSMEVEMDIRSIRAQLLNSYLTLAKGKKGIIYAININHARHICNEYQEAGFNVVCIDSKTPSQERKNSTCTGGYDRILSCKLNADSAIP
jgi:superfamily II DNA or RNA helicase